MGILARRAREYGVEAMKGNMKRFVFFGIAVAVLLFFLLQGRNHQVGAPGQPNTASEAAAVSDLTNQQDVTTRGGEIGAEQAKSVPVTNSMGYEDPETIRAFNESPDVPISFYGVVEDQDSNALQNVKVELRIIQWQPTTPLGEDTKMIQIESETGPDGRFNVSGMSGHAVTVLGFWKDGYEPEFMRGDYGRYGPHSGSREKPEIFRMWNTNLAQSLITAEKSFVVIPDGRHYAIDLLKGTITEADNGDLVAWIKRPESVKWGQKYNWSCGLEVPTGGLSESSEYLMFRAPEAGYTNTFRYQEDEDVNGWGGETGKKRFYINLRNGQMYGRVTVELYADYYGKQPAMIRLSYSINPSGSRMLRDQVLVPPRQVEPSRFPAQLTWPPR